ncbi:hypothetical protein BJ875DRAFT_253720 [Amylocarpus encephaloides]|uniref:UspA domain-containing protein n=1 Tax=Amylocarpus encephaloides TaxID=45428 RepID=A0A9P7YLP6_9HELO|nr:hypothetical protein BJ875DRAFT_253720 [Amylocarpus encephaloides]
MAQSLESMLDEERRDVLALLEEPPAARHGSTSSGVSARDPSPFTPRSPIRSMLDIGEAPHVRNGSIASVASSNGGTAKPKPPQMGKVRSMLDLDTPPPSTSSTSLSDHTPPTQPIHKPYVSNSSQHRSLSDASARPAEFGPRSNVLAMETSTHPSSAYQFAGYLPTNPGGPVVPKRNTQAGKKTSLPSAMSEVVRGGDLSVFGSRDRGRNHSVAGAGINTVKSRSPHNRLGLRSNSPHTNALTPDPSKYVVLNDGRTIDMQSAYRRLSDANLALSGGALSTLAGKSRRRTNSDGQNGNRLAKDYVPVEGEFLADSSDDEYHSSNEESRRGRKKHDKKRDGEEVARPMTTTVGMGLAKSHSAPKSLLAAAEEERVNVAAQNKYKIRSLLDPEITVTAPSGAKLKSTNAGVHPNTSFDVSTTGLNTPVDSDTEADLTDIKRAQKLSVNMTPIVSTPATSRSVRTLYRGDFTKMQQEAYDNQRRVRKYLVATDLSDEAAHALEWTIGTVLRDGDTLLAIYCVDEELGIETSADDAHLKEQAVAVANAARSSTGTPILGPAPAPSPLGPGYRLDTGSANASPMGRVRDKPEHDRYKAVQDITDRVSKLLRKTKLQVKVVIEVIHCKSPKHLITEVIDFISPTLVILGSRGRSALKGVILGSFSNYLVTKSSVPVMVARKRLRKHLKYKRPPIRLANNLQNPVRSLEAARID